MVIPTRVPITDRAAVVFDSKGRTWTQIIGTPLFAADGFAYTLTPREIETYMGVSSYSYPTTEGQTYVGPIYTVTTD